MKTHTRFILGLLSSLFLICGLTRAAERFDPNTAKTNDHNAKIKSVAPDSTLICYRS